MVSISGYNRIFLTFLWKIMDIPEILRIFVIRTIGIDDNGKGYDTVG